MTRPSRRRAGLSAVCLATIALVAACGDDDDDSPDDTEIDILTTEVTVGTVVTSEVEVTDTTTFTSDVVSTEPDATTED